MSSPWIGDVDRPRELTGRDGEPLTGREGVVSAGAVAVPSALAYATLTSWGLTALSATVSRATVSVPAGPSTTVAPVIVMFGPSSSRIVPVAVPLPIVAFTGSARSTENVSSSSSTVSPTICTLTF